jgi:hypothetical protein
MKTTYWVRHTFLSQATHILVFMGRPHVLRPSTRHIHAQNQSVAHDQSFCSAHDSGGSAVAYFLQTYNSAAPTPGADRKLSKTHFNPWASSRCGQATLVPILQAIHAARDRWLPIVATIPAAQQEESVTATHCWTPYQI